MTCLIILSLPTAVSLVLQLIMLLHITRWHSSATTLDSIRNTWLFRTTVTALTEPCTHWRISTLFPSPSRWVVLHTYLLYFVSGRQWRIHTIRTTRVLNSSQGLKFWSGRLRNAWWCLCLSSADSHMPHSHLCLALRFCHLLQYSLCLRYIRLPLHLLRHYRIFHVWNILSNLHTL